METEVKVETLDDSGDESLPVQFLGMVGGTGVKVKDDPEDNLADDIKALPYKLLDADLLKSTMATTSFLSELTITFEEKLKMKMFRLMHLLEAMCHNIKTHGMMENWDWSSMVSEVNKSVKTTLSFKDVQKKTLLILDWLIRRDVTLVKTWKSDLAQEEFLQATRPTGGVVEDFVVVKAEHDDCHNNSGEITEEKPIIPIEVKTEDDMTDDGGSKAIPMNTGEIPSDMQVMKAGTAPKERFFHNGEELDLEDVLDTYGEDEPGTSTGGKKKKSGQADSEESEMDEDEEDVDKDDEGEYKPTDSEGSEIEAVPEEGEEEEEDEEEEENEDDEEEEKEEEEEEEEEEGEGADPGSTSLNMLKQALMRKRGQSSMTVQKNTPDSETAFQASTSTSISTSSSSTIPPASKTTDPNIGGTSLSIKDLTEVERTVLEATVASNIEVFKTTASTVEEREKKMAVWREIAKKVNNAGGKSRTPEELVTIWSKKLFVDHVSSKKSLLINKESDKTVNGTATNAAFRSLISKSVPEKKTMKTTPTASLPPAAFAKSVPSSSQQAKAGPWSVEEKQVFEEQLEKFKTVFQSHVADRFKPDKLKEVWQEITEKVNAVNKGPPRSVDELQKKWTMELIQSNPSSKGNFSTQMTPRGRPGRPMISSSAGDTSAVENVYPGTTRPQASATVTSDSVVESPIDTPIKIELDNAESDQTRILQVVDSGISSSQTISYSIPVQTPPTVTTAGSQVGTISFQLMDPVTMETSAVSLPRACVKLQLEDKSEDSVDSSGDASSSLDVKDEPTDDTTFSSSQSRMINEFIAKKVSMFTLTVPSVIKLVMTPTDWENLVQLVNQADPTLIHSVANIKEKVSKTIKLMDNLLPSRISNLNVTSVRDGESLPQKRPHVESPEPVEQSKKVRVERKEDIVSPRWAKGDLVQAKNGDVWCEATIVDIDETEGQVKVHYNGLTQGNDQWMTMSSELLMNQSRCFVKLPRLSKPK